MPPPAVPPGTRAPPADARLEADAIETVELREEDGVTTMTDCLAFTDQATRDSTKWLAADGVHADEGGQVSLDRLEDYLAAGNAS